MMLLLLNNRKEISRPKKKEITKKKEKQIGQIKF